MSWKRGNGSVNVELSRVQGKLEDWSEELDGEAGMIREFREDRAERRGTVKLLKWIVSVLGAMTGVQVILEIVRSAHH